MHLKEQGATVYETATPIFNLKSRSKMQKIEVSKTNVFEERSKEFLNSKLAQRLQDKYKAQPYEERRKVLYQFSQIGSWLCHGLAVIASTSYVFGFCYSLLAKIDLLPYPSAFSALIVLCVLFFIEGLKRATVPDLFKDVFQFGFAGSYFTRIIAIIALISVSTFFSFKGGHEFVELVMNPPTYNEPKEKNIEAIRERYKPKIANAKRNAEAYRHSKLWQGRLSDAHANQYKQLLENVTKLENDENKEIQDLQGENRESKRLARIDFETSQQEHKRKLEQRGTGFAGFSIFGEILFILFVWFMERYDYKTAMQYAVLATDSVETETTQKNDVPTTKSDNTLPQQTAPPQHSQNGQTNLTPTNFVERRQIGFYTQAQRMSENLLQKNTQTAQTGQSSKQDDPNAKIVYNDRYTILHNGQKTKQRYTLARIRNYQKTYIDRENKAREKGKRSVAEHNAQQVKYWQERERELLEKLK